MLRSASLWGDVTFLLDSGDFRCGTERIVETYYNMPFHKGLTLAADYQRVINRAVIAGRGPASFCAIRFHGKAKSEHLKWKRHCAVGTCAN